MTPVSQRIVDPHRGDCQTACVATLLDLPYEAVPTWLADAMDAYLANRTDQAGRRAQPHDWHPAMAAWLAARGLHLLAVEWRHLTDWRALPGALCIASMPSQRYPDASHAVVARFENDPADPLRTIRLAVVHDPNPGNAPYPPDAAPARLAFLVPLDPARPTSPPGHRGATGRPGVLLTGAHMELVAALVADARQQPADATRDRLLGEVARAITNAREHPPWPPRTP